MEIFDLENNELNNKNIYLCITMSIQRKDKGEEEDDFKDEDINEMILKDSSLLEDKLKRQFPNCDSLMVEKSNLSHNNFPEISSKNEKDYSESSIHITKKSNIIQNNSNKSILKIKGFSNIFFDIEAFLNAERLIIRHFQMESRTFDEPVDR